MPPTTKIPTLTPWELFTAMLDANAPRILVSGPPGLGKSYTPAKWAAKNGWEFLSITLTDQTEAADLRGHFILKGNEFVWHDGMITRAWRMSQNKQKVVVEINEIVEAGADVEVFLHNALDDPEFARLDLPTEETIRPAANNIMVVATMNGDPRMLREALRDRFPVRLEVNDPHPDAIVALPADLRPIAMSMTSHTMGEKRMSVRPFVAFAQLRAKMQPLVAAQAVFGAQAHDILAAIGVSGLRSK